MISGARAWQNVFVCLQTKDGFLRGGVTRAEIGKDRRVLTSSSRISRIVEFFLPRANGLWKLTWKLGKGRCAILGFLGNPRFCISRGIKKYLWAAVICQTLGNLLGHGITGRIIPNS